MALPCGPSGPRLRRALAFALVALTLPIENGPIYLSEQMRGGSLSPTGVDVALDAA